MNGTPPVVYPQPPKRTGWIVYSVIATFFLMMSVFANFVLLALMIAAGGRAGLESRRAAYEEHFLQGDTDSRNKIAVIYLNGVIKVAEPIDEASFPGLLARQNAAVGQS